MLLAVRTYLESLFGSVTNDELFTVAIIILAILLFGWAPRWGEMLGAAWSGVEPDEPPPPNEPPPTADTAAKKS